MNLKILKQGYALVMLVLVVTLCWSDVTLTGAKILSTQVIELPENLPMTGAFNWKGNLYAVISVEGTENFTSPMIYRINSFGKVIGTLTLPVSCRGATGCDVEFSGFAFTGKSTVTLMFQSDEDPIVVLVIVDLSSFTVLRRSGEYTACDSLNLCPTGLIETGSDQFFLPLVKAFPDGDGGGPLFPGFSYVNDMDFSFQHIIQQMTFIKCAPVEAITDGIYSDYTILAMGLSGEDELHTVFMKITDPGLWPIITDVLIKPSDGTFATVNSNGVLLIISNDNDDSTQLQMYNHSLPFPTKTVSIPLAPSTDTQGMLSDTMHLFQLSSGGGYISQYLLGEKTAILIDTQPLPAFGAGIQDNRSGGLSTAGSALIFPSRYGNIVFVSYD